MMKFDLPEILARDNRKKGKDIKKAILTV